MTFLFPFKDPYEFGEPDWRGAEVLDFGLVNDRVKPLSSGHYVWWGAISLPGRSNRRYLPLILEFPYRNIPIDAHTTGFSVATPPGRPGNPMTVLMDHDGEIVPELHFPLKSDIYVLPIAHDWDTFGWTLMHPAIALHFANGVCHRSKLAITNWQSYLLRNKA